MLLLYCPVTNSLAMMDMIVMMMMMMILMLTMMVVEVWIGDYFIFALPCFSKRNSVSLNSSAAIFKNALN